MKGRMNFMNSIKRLVFLALMVSLSLILSIIESWLPVPSVIPGVKLGLANIITIIVIMNLGFKDSIYVVTVRCILSSIYGSGFIGFLFSITGGILSTIVMAFLYKRFPKMFSIVGISLAGSTAHNVGQLLVASILMRELVVMTYLPVLLISGLIMGFFVGLCSHYLSISLRKTNLFCL